MTKNVRFLHVGRYHFFPFNVLDYIPRLGEAVENEVFIVIRSQETDDATGQDVAEIRQEATQLQNLNEKTPGYLFQLKKRRYSRFHQFFKMVLWERVFMHAKTINIELQTSLSTT